MTWVLEWGFIRGLGVECFTNNVQHAGFGECGCSHLVPLRSPQDVVALRPRVSPSGHWIHLPGYERKAVVVAWSVDENDALGRGWRPWCRVQSICGNVKGMQRVLCCTRNPHEICRANHKRAWVLGPRTSTATIVGKLLMPWYSTSLELTGSSTSGCPQTENERRRRNGQR
jgi:hypothetical protein